MQGSRLEIHDAVDLARNSWLEKGFWAAALVGTVLSVAVTGFLFGVANNVFHLGIVGGLFDQPQFSDDRFVQSLRYFAAGPWLLLRGAEQWGNPYWIFFIGFVLSRFVSFVGFLACARILGVTAPRRQMFFALLLATTFLLRGFSFAGGGGLFIEYFTHSEIANGLFLLTIYAVLRGHVGVAVALTGAIFFVNAFFGVWAAVVVVVVVVRDLLANRRAWRPVLVSTLIGAVVAALFAAPVLLNILHNPEFGHPPAFDYLDFLRRFFPYHFLYGSIPVADRIALALIAVAGLMTVRVGWPEDDRFAVVLWACIGVYVVGIFVPLVTRSPVILNLHLLRSGTLVHLVVALLVCALATRWWFERAHEGMNGLLASLLVIVASSSSTGRLRFVLIGALIVLIVTATPWGERKLATLRLERIFGDGRKLRLVAVVWLFAVAPIAAGLSWNAARVPRAWVSEWLEVGAWARDHTPVDSVFLLPVVSFVKSAELTDEGLGAKYDNVFEYASHRVAWVDYVYGAAAMWSPSYLETWSARLAEVSTLEGLPDKIAYARAKEIGYVITMADRGCGDGSVFKTARLCVFAANQPEFGKTMK